MLRNFIEKHIANNFSRQTPSIIINSMEDSSMIKNSKIKQEMLTVISMSDNPNLNLKVAKPSKYKIEKTLLGTGIMCYKTNAIEILQNTLNKNEKILRIELDMQRIKALDLCSSKDKQYLKDVYNTITDKTQIESDTDFLDYVCENGVREYTAILGLTVLGGLLFDKSIIADYTDKCLLIKDRSLIVSVKEV